MESNKDVKIQLIRSGVLVEEIKLGDLSDEDCKNVEAELFKFARLSYDFNKEVSK